MNRAVDRRPLRADAARNVDKIITAARQCFRERGPEVPLQTIAVTAGVGPATLFRNFADKEELVLAALMGVASDDANLLGAVAGRRGLLTGITGGMIESVAVLLGRGQGQGTLRSDISMTDMIRILAMLIGVVDTMEPGSDAWRRPVALIEDAIRAERPQRPLPPQSPLSGAAFG
jgi:AcrR family transcriptional regulator